MEHPNIWRFSTGLSKFKKRKPWCVFEQLIGGHPDPPTLIWSSIWRQMDEFWKLLLLFHNNLQQLNGNCIHFSTSFKLIIKLCIKIKSLINYFYFFLKRRRKNIYSLHVVESSSHWVGWYWADLEFSRRWIWVGGVLPACTLYTKLFQTSGCHKSKELVR